MSLNYFPAHQNSIKSFDKFIYPEQFGAVGDLQTDDTEAVQKALEAAYSSNGDRGLVVLTKKYLVDPLYQIDNTGILGVGDALLKLKPQTIDIFSHSNISVLSALGTSSNPYKNITLKDFTIDWNLGTHVGEDRTKAPGNQEGIEWDYVFNSTIDNVTVIDAHADSFDLDQSAYNLLINCKAINAGKAGFQFSFNSHQNYVAFNYAENCAKAREHRAAFTAVNGTRHNTYIGNKGKNNYRNFELLDECLYYKDPFFEEGVVSDNLDDDVFIVEGQRIGSL